MSTVKASIIYISGYGRSGSTLLDTMLGNHPDLFGGGELTWLFRFAQDASQECSCGHSLHECDVWSAVFSAYHCAFPQFPLAEAAALNLRCERLGGRASEQDLRQYREFWKVILSTLRRVSGKSVIVDSSKVSRLSYHRLKLLSTTAGEQVKTIHLTRDPRAVMQSVAQGSNRRTEAGVDNRISGGMYRGLMGWIVSNTLTERVSSNLPEGCTYNLRYEDLTEDPEATLQQLEPFIGFDLSSLETRCQEQQAFSPEHGLSGNRMRRAGRIVLQSGDRKAANLNFPGKIATRLAQTMMRRYGYK